MVGLKYLKWSTETFISGLLLLLQIWEKVDKRTGDYIRNKSQHLPMYSSWSTKPSPFLSISSKVSWKIVRHQSNQERTENSCYSPLQSFHVLRPWPALVHRQMYSHWLQCDCCLYNEYTNILSCWKNSLCESTRHHASVRGREKCASNT